MRAFGLLVLGLVGFFGGLEGLVVIERIPAGGVVVDQPGEYELGRDVVWRPGSAGQAISITANGVTLDLKGHKLEAKTRSFQTTGIVATGVDGLRIENGTVANMSFMGIRCDGCTNVVIERVTVDGLTLEETATYTVPVGIAVLSSENVWVSRCKVKNIDVKTGSVAAIQMTETINSTVALCKIKNLLNRDGACTGIGHLLCDEAVVQLCKLEKIESQFIDNLNTEGHTAIGIIPVTTTNLEISGCKISDITGCCDDAHGMSLFECLGAVVDDCRVKNVLDGNGAAQTGAKATGIEIYASGVVVSNCKVKNIVAINPQDKQATGFSCAQCIGVEFSNCEAKNVSVVDAQGRQSASLGYGTGFGWAPDPRPDFVEPAVDILYTGCKAENCQVGFDTWFHQNALWSNIISKCNDIAVLNEPSSQRTLSCNPCSECNPPLTVTIDNVASGNVFGNVIVKECR